MTARTACPALLPCQCGGALLVAELIFDSGTKWQISCSSCQQATALHFTRKDAEDAWNRRHPHASAEAVRAACMRAVVEECPACDGAGYVVVERTGYGHACGGDERLCRTKCPVPIPEQAQEPCEYCARVEGAIRALDLTKINAAPNKEQSAEAHVHTIECRAKGCSISSWQEDLRKEPSHD